MTVAHIFITAAFILLGGIGLTLIQQAIVTCCRHINTGNNRPTDANKADHALQRAC